MMLPLTWTAQLWIAGAVASVLISFGTVQTVRLANTRTALAQEQRDRKADVARLEQAAREQVERFRATETAWKNAQNENALLARKARELAAVDAAAAGDAAGRLRQRVATLAATCREPARDPAAVAAGPAASAPGDLFAELLSRMDAAARLVVAYADAASISAEQCAADYTALTRKGDD